MNAPKQTDSTKARLALVHREILQVAVLIAIAGATFFVTRAIAANNRDMNLRDAAEWYRRGQRQLEAGDPGDAVDAFRRATVKNRNDKRYVLALARALAGTKQDEAARSALLALRESAPEDPDINLQLARLDAEGQDVAEALRYYHNALYAPWPADQADARRHVRVELIRFLLTHDQANRALSELVALSTDLPDDAAAHVEAGQLFLSAGDHTRALGQFQRALRLAPADGAALAGAGEGAVEAGDYALAQQYLHRAPDDLDEVKEKRALVELVLSNDPLAARLGASARRQRLLDDLARVTERLDTCVEGRPDGQLPADVAMLDGELQAFKARLKPGRSLEDDTIQSGVELIDRVEQAAVQACPPQLPLDRALMLIGQRHRVDQR